MNMNKYEKKIIERMKAYDKRNSSFWVRQEEGTYLMSPYHVAMIETEEKIEGKEMDDIKFSFVKSLGSVVFDKTLPSPDLKEVKENIKNLVGRKRTQNVLYSFGKGLPRVNARYMADILELIEGYQIDYISDEYFIKIIGNKGFAYLLPIKIYGKKEKGYYLF